MEMLKDALFRCKHIPARGVFPLTAVVDERFLPSDRQRDDLPDWLGQCLRNGHALRAFLSSIALAALRPQEAVALQLRDVHLPDEGPGELVIRPRCPGKGDEAVEGAGVVRLVPASPELVVILRADVTRRCLGPEELMFTRDDGRPLPGAVYRRAWHRARKAVLEARGFDDMFSATAVGGRLSPVARPQPHASLTQDFSCPHAHFLFPPPYSALSEQFS
ncbi:MULTISPECIES: hypothetical protein [unclassified Streptomyces]|uniref:hypothetical protein n=1 Tax=unclassified Streptomyces TaxID=2593676 RepID=UPI000B0691CF|nr:hypothetical protein [Streptomyces sp. TSRI0281]